MADAAQAFGRLEIGTVGRLHFGADLLTLDHVLNFGKREAKEVLKALDLLDPEDIFVGVQPEAAFQASRRLQEAALLIKSQGSLGHARAVGDLADLEIGLIVRPRRLRMRHLDLSNPILLTL